MPEVMGRSVKGNVMFRVIVSFIIQFRTLGIKGSLLIIMSEQQAQTIKEIFFKLKNQPQFF